VAKPGTLPIFGTDANLASGTESGSTVILEPAAAVKAQGWVPGVTFVGRWWNWWANLVYQWIQYVDGLHNEVQFLNKLYSWTNQHNFRNAVFLDHASEELQYGDGAGGIGVRTRVVQLMASTAGSGDPVTPSIFGKFPTTGYATFVIDAAVQAMVWPLRVPYDGSIRQVRAVVVPGAGTMVLKLHRHTPNFSTPGAGTAVVNTTLDTSAGTGAQLLDSGTISHPVGTDTQSWAVSIENTNNVDNATVAAVEITFLDPGPRNH
jgi:hypothetical protein